MDLPRTMHGYELTGHGGLDRLVWHEDLPVPAPGPGDVLVRVVASSVNNTDVNTRTGWYSPSVRSGTDAGAVSGYGDLGDGGWSGGDLRFPRIQGADCFGEVVATGAEVPDARVGERVVVRTMQSAPDLGSWACRTLGSELDGGFAQFTAVPSRHALAVPDGTGLTDAEWGALGCSSSTAENMLQRVGLGAERVLVTGASGGVGLAAVQLAALRGAHVTAMTSPAKATALRAAGAAETIGRDDAVEPAAFDVVVDLVAGPRWADVLAGLRVGGRYVASGAIAGPVVELDVRDLYLRDLTLIGATFQPDAVLPAVLGYVAEGRFRPVVAATYPLRELPAAQRTFLAKQHVGSIAIAVG
ncbi:zinc-binding dehydrogenase [Actinotalea sp. M2MS4P-6]|uniref:alcohol dehydrogenase catalytic domain-containing protein n=1 Tax=Actinotalea sp. M2MS4P-6 TaxID=2983762 RepID=UPI0021E413F2|nr:zinc-binding dehydrogenase [Actinotalea sp. M2MS4P-6]MCV2395169.1 zinc-binding dehydrogenase [Actinotalea sp. M2MS4P-6]